MIIPLILGAAGTGVGTFLLTKEDAAAVQHEELYNLYKVQISRGNYQVYFDQQEEVMIDYKNKEVYYIETGPVGKTVVKALVNENLEPIQRHYWFTDGRSFGRDKKNDWKPLDKNNQEERVDIFSRGLRSTLFYWVPQRGGEYTSADQSRAMTPKILAAKIAGATGKFREMEVKILEAQTEILEKVIKKVDSLSAEEKEALFAKLPAEDVRNKFLAEFTKHTGIDLSKSDPKIAFIAVCNSLEANKDQPIVRSNLSPESLLILDNYYKSMKENVKSNPVLRDVKTKVATETASVMAPVQASTQTGPSEEAAVAGPPDVLGKLKTGNYLGAAKDLMRTSWGKVVLGLGLMVGGAPLAGLLGGLIPGVGPLIGTLGPIGAVLGGLYLIATNIMPAFSEFSSSSKKNKDAELAKNKDPKLQSSIEKQVAPEKEPMEKDAKKTSSVSTRQSEAMSKTGAVVPPTDLSKFRETVIQRA